MLAGSNTLENRQAIVSGWGSLKFGTSKFPKELHSVNVKVWNNNLCNSNYGSQAPGGITPRMMCASLPGKDSCQVQHDTLYYYIEASRLMTSTNIKVSDLF